MRQYLVNRVLRSIFSIIMVMILSVVLIFSLIPLDYVVKQNPDIATAKKISDDDAIKKELEVLQKHGYIEYVSQVDYCKSIMSDTTSDDYKACVARADTNKYKKDFIKKYEDMGWKKVILNLPKMDNADYVTRAAVNSGAYTPKADQYFKEEDSSKPEDQQFLYYQNEKGKELQVTFNNVTYFRRKTNPLKTFWGWFSNLIKIDNKNAIENYQEWNPETESYLTLEDKYDITFSFVEKSTNDKKIEGSPIAYSYSEGDENFVVGTMKIKGEEYHSFGGVASSYLVSEKTLKGASLETNGSVNENGTIKVEFEFTDGSKDEKTVDVTSFLTDNLVPLYVGSNGYYYIGNLNLNIKYEKEHTDWGHSERNYIVQITPDIKFSASSIKRGYSIEKDEYGTPAVVCRGCNYKYAVYFTNSFPFIHFNIVKFSLGESLNNYRGYDVTNLLTDKQGQDINSEVTFPTGNVQKASIESFHTCSYKKTLDVLDKKNFNDNYANCKSLRGESSMMGISFIIGILSTLVAYFIGIPIGVLMAKYKDGIFDKIAMVYIIVMFSVPSLAYIYFMSYLGRNWFHLPQNYEYGNYLTYIMPVVSLSLGSIASLMMWTRRYMIDQGNADYVKFARAKGLGEGQIFFKHILRNAIVPIAHGVPGSIVGAVVGALITEQVYGIPGTGKLMVTAVQTYDNWVAIGLIFFYTVLGIVSMILGDITITLVDPRISFVDTGGRK